MTQTSAPDPSTSNDEISLLPLLAGYRPDGEAIIEQVNAIALPDAKNAGEAQVYRLQYSPAFVRGLAAGDRIRFPADTPEGYSLVKRSGNLCIRVMNKHSMVPVLQALRLLKADGLVQDAPGRGLRVTPLICYDLRFGEIFRARAETTDLFVVIANWPEARR